MNAYSTQILEQANEMNKAPCTIYTNYNLTITINSKEISTNQSQRKKINIEIHHILPLVFIT